MVGKMRQFSVTRFKLLAVVAGLGLSASCFAGVPVMDGVPTTSLYRGLATRRVFGAIVDGSRVLCYDRDLLFKLRGPLLSVNKKRRGEIYGGRTREYEGEGHGKRNEMWAALHWEELSPGFGTILAHL